uniref:KilA-N domain-containing protein n=1 Tax=viral metagenome TaxID=1070528 RepID=A0A6C0CB52_9ZZZZ
MSKAKVKVVYESDESFSSIDSFEEYDQHDIRNICYKKINDEYSYGKYGQHKVIVMMKNGYFNIDHLCKKFNKKFEDWVERDTSKEFIKCLSKLKNIPRKDLIQKIKGNSEISGTYIHSLLFVQVMMWASPVSACNVSDIIDNNR